MYTLKWTRAYDGKIKLLLKCLFSEHKVLKYYKKMSLKLNSLKRQFEIHGLKMSFLVLCFVDILKENDIVIKLN